MNTGIHRRAGARGMSMVELMVAITISLILLAGIIQLFVSNKVTYETTDDLSRLQENARFAVDALTRDLRMGGFFGCHDNGADSDVVRNHLDVADATLGDLVNAKVALEGLNNAAAGTTWQHRQGAGEAAPATIRPGTDAVTVRFLDPDAATPIDEANPMTSTSAAVAVTDGSMFQQGDLVGVSDCASADIFQVTNADPAATNSVAHGTDAITPGNTAASLGRVYSEGWVSRLATKRYFVGDNAGGRPPSLYVETVSGSGASRAKDTVELVEGIENLQVLYGVDNGEVAGTTAGDGVPDTYKNAAELSNTDWTQVVALRLALLAVTVDELGQQLDTGSYDLLDQIGYTPNPADRRQRRVFTTTVLIRNLQ